VFPIQPICFGTSNKKLASIGIGPRVRHGQHACFIMFVKKIFVMKRSSIDTELASSVVVDEVPALYHEIFHNSMKHGVFVARWLLAL
jgi:hypothetical protein